MKFTPNNRTVAVPPASVYKFSVYDELKLGEDKYKELLNAIHKPSKGNKHAKTKHFIKSVINVAIIATLGFLGYKYRSNIGNFFKNIIGKK